MTHLGDPGPRQEIVKRLALLKRDANAQWGSMTPAQMICHLNDSFLVAIGEKMANVDARLLNRTIVKWGALYIPLRWPKGVRTRPELEAGAGGTRPGDFDSDRAKLVGSLERFCNPCRAFAYAPHPLFGVMNERQWLRWGYLHTDHHLRQFGL